MRRRWLFLLPCLQVCLCALAVAALVNAAAQPLSLRVNEATTRISLGEGHGKISLAVENHTGRAAPAHIKLELLDPHDKVVARTQRRETLKQGANVVAAFLPVSSYAPPGDEVRQLLWYRLRYVIARADATGAGAPVLAEGIISLSEITPDLFELQVAAASKANAGQLYRVRVRATHPLASRPVRGVEVAAEVDFNAGDADQTGGALKSSGITDRDGYVTLDFKLPARVATTEGEIKVTGRRGSVVQTASDEVEIGRTTRILLTSDKPLYQPGQTLHLRALLLNHATRRAIPDAEATLEIKDPEDTTIFTTTLRTSRFGVASCDWPIPDNTRLGDYHIRVTANNDDDDESQEHAASQRVKISRYELPNFAVSATPDRGYYLPGESAQVEVRGDYLFGQPLKRGRVRLVRETEREWNYKEQKYDIREGDKYEGVLGADGSFRARVNLSKEHAELAGNSWQRFTDLNYAAYVTDPTTNRTEQRRFRVRLSKEPIHIYVTQLDWQATGLPLAFYVTTSYADGTPASCELQLTHEETEGERVKIPATIRTNAYGVAKVVGSELTASEENYIYIQFAARDREGRAGQHVENFWRNSKPVLRVETDKTIYRAGEGITARISSNQPDMKILLDVVSNNRVLATATARLRGGRAILELPYRPEFQNRITLAAYTTEFPENSYNDAYPRGTGAVIYPRNRELKFDVRMSRASYRPGEEAEAGVRVRTAAGRDVESALGVVVFDKAVEERARTEQEFGSTYGFSGYFHQFWYGSESIAGLGLRDIEQLDATRPLPAGLEVVADLLLRRDHDYYRPNLFNSSAYDTNQSHVFDALVSAQLRATREALKAHHDKGLGHPTDEAGLRARLADAGIALAELRDPWGLPFRPAFFVEREQDVLEFRSAGADKRHGTADDWTAARLTWHYFRPVGEAINRAVIEHHRRTGGFVRDAATLKAELARADFDFDALRDRWGQPYALSFHVNGTHYVIDVQSGGPDGRITPTPTSQDPRDDFTIWTTSTDYFAETRARIDSAIADLLKTTRIFPRDEPALREALRRVGLDLANLRDPWGHPYYANFHTETRYADRIVFASGGAAESTRRTSTTPVTRLLEFVTLRSAGADGQTGTSDDFNVAEVSRIVSDQSAQDAKPQVAADAAAVTFSGDSGAIGGTIQDPSDAVIVGAAVKATHQQRSEHVFETTTGEDGQFLLRNLPAGLYTLQVTAPGFTQMLMTDVQVFSATLASVTFTLNVATVSETVTVVSSQVSELAVKGSNFSSLLKVKPGARPAQDGTSSTGKPPISTPRLRKDFPETLTWQPAVETDRHGRARLRFKLADNITTWKMSIIGSTETGELGTIEREIRAFQPFFVEHDPPRILTEGDEISLPVVLRNYLEQAQTVALDIKSEDWFTMIGPARKQASVAAGDASRETFDFRAVASVKEGLQRITAIGGDASDQIERPVHVHPDGEEVAETATQILRESSLLEVEVPAAAIPRSARAELKIYPNLMAHAIESVEAIMSRPYGCAEQTISSTYPSLLVLRHYKRAGGDATPPAAAPPIAAKAARYVRQGYERLLSYRSGDGGFSYWGRGEPDLALTAYAVRFLTDAREFTSIDESALADARAWLVRQQKADGGWAAYSWDKNSDGRRRDAVLTSYIARILAAYRPVAAPTPPGRQSDDQQTAQEAPLRRALAYLAPRTEEMDEPYLIASYALAAIDGGESPDKIARAIRRLRALAHDEAGGSYWELETNTPFHGWGNAGRIETTALAVQALSKAKRETDVVKNEGARERNHRPPAQNEGAGVKDEGAGVKGESAGTKDESAARETPAPPAGRRAPVAAPIASKASAPSAPAREIGGRAAGELVDRGLLFLLKNKDRYGVWLSTQATVNVLDALNALSTPGAATVRGDQVVAASQSEAQSESQPAAGSRPTAEVFVNGRSAGLVALPATHEPANPVSLDLSPFVVAGGNRVEIKRTGGGGGLVASAQLVTTYYRPWPAVAPDGLHARPQDARSLSLKVGFDRTTATTGDTVTCRVAAERIGHRGYGMLLAEIGLPPGADVDRASLEQAMKNSGWEFSHYDVLPDRLVVYLWPRAGGTKFEFTFRPRYGLAAKSAPSVVYDYYNPEARAVLAPTKFKVDERAKTAPAQAGRE